jgi:hypothetical protein
MDKPKGLKGTQDIVAGHMPLLLSIGKAYRWGTLPKCGARLGYCLMLGPHYNASPYTFDHKVRHDCVW